MTGRDVVDNIGRMAGLQETTAGESTRSFLRFITCGSVDDGKSTLIGRLLFESKLIHEDQFVSLERDSRKYGTTGDEVDLALLVDGLEDERQQGITIDVAYRFFSTPSRAFMVADTPGHEQYTRNMATGASNTDAEIILVDARKGVLRQTKRHAAICSLLGIREIIVAINKIDLVDFEKATFDRIVGDFVTFASKLDFRNIVPVPVSARFGDNVTVRSGNMPWFGGTTLMEALEAIDVVTDRAQRPFRLAVQWVNRPNLDFRGYCGTIDSGRVAVGDAVHVAPSGLTAAISRILGPDGPVDAAEAGDAVSLVLSEEIDVSRGDVFSTPRERPNVADQFQAHMIWMAEEPMLPGRQYLMRIGTRFVPATITAIKHRIDIETSSELAAKELAMNEIAVCNLSTQRPVAFDAYKDIPETGSFILIDRFTNATVAAGMIDFPLRRSTNVHRQAMTVDKTARAEAKGQRPAIVWFTGLSGSGKSTVADAVEKRLHAAGRHTYALDGDNVRHGLNRDLGFTDVDRVENIRRVGEVAKLMVDAGLIVLCSFISPFAAERRLVREMVEEQEFIEVFVDTPIEECMSRDPKGLYAKAKRGEIKNFTGFDSPYEAPSAPELRLQTAGKTPEELADAVVSLLAGRGIAP